MVMRLPLPNVDSVQLVGQVVAERAGGPNRHFFNGIAPEWEQRVQDYINAQGSPPLVPQWNAIEPKKNSFLNLYLSPAENSVQGQMLKAMRLHDLTVCPACGELGRPNTLDHYLPKNAYPHFCITPANLFPMCDACQTAKGDKVGNAQSPRFFVHPYFDVFVGGQVLRLLIREPFDAPEFQLVVDNTLNAADAAVVRGHLRELKIEQRYAHFFRGEYRRLLRLVDAMRSSGQNVEATLTIFKLGKMQPSLNGWDHVFYASVLAHPDLLHFLTTADLPDFL